MKRTHVSRWTKTLVLAGLALSVALLAGRSRTSADPEPGAPAPCPVSLSNPDGQHLDLTQYDIRVAMHGPLALTEMEMIFRNPQDRLMEGKFLYLLPPGATVSRFSKEVDGKLMEGEVVERQRARSVYRQILHTMRDPALLEQDQGNRFSARVFPIPAKGQVRLLLSYSQLLTAQDNLRTLRIPLAGMPSIGKFSFQATVHAWPGEQVRTESIGEMSHSGRQAGTQQHFALVRENYTPQQDIEMSFQTQAARDHAVRTLRAGAYQMTSFRPLIRVKAREMPHRDWHLYIDTSASNADTFERRCDALSAFDSLMRERREALYAYAFDMDVELIARHPNHPGGNDRTLRALGYTVKQRQALGATDLAKALKHLGETARAAEQPGIFVLASDGIASWGAREVKDLLDALGDWPERHVMHALVLGSKQDQRALKALVAKTHGRIVEVPLNESTRERLAKAMPELTEPQGETFEFYDEAAEWIHPRVFKDVRPGSELIVFSKLKDGAQAKPGAVHRSPGGEIVKDHVFDAKPADEPGYAPLLERQAHKAFLAHLEQKVQQTDDDKAVAALNKQMIDVSVKNRVLCPLTSLLVLETEDDYARFGIDRAALADIMEVGPQGIRLKTRELSAEEAAQLQAAKAEATKKAERAKASSRVRKKAGAVREELKELKDEVAHLRRQQGEAGRVEATLDNRYGPNSDALEKTVAGFSGLSEIDSEVDASQGGVNAFSQPEEAAANPFIASPQPQRANQQLAQQAEEETEQTAAGGRVEEIELQINDVRDLTHDLPRSQPAQTQAVKTQMPAWTKAYHRAPSAAELQALIAQVNITPRDRKPRNLYAEALAKAAKWDELQAACFEWLPFDPENPQVFEFLGTSLEKLNDPKKALRAVTSIAEIGPSNHALLARAGWLLLVSDKPELAAEMFAAALKQRDDHPNHYRGLGLSYFMAGKYEKAEEVLKSAMKKDFNRRYGDVTRVLREELGYVYRAWLSTVDDKKSITARAYKSGINLDRTDALRVTLCWETDANDVDLHVADPQGQVCFYGFKKTISELELYSDQTQGLGPEVIRTSGIVPGLYHIGVKYFNAGPMGTSRGVVVIHRPVDGVCKKPIVRPFTLVPDGSDIRHLFAEEF